MEKIKKSVIYEVNLRQYTPEGTINAFIEHIPRLADMGIGILWIMPIQPIGKKNRKGTLGSYYSISNYIAVNPEFGTEKDFARLVEVTHEFGMLLILDWVANHTSWDNVWIDAHPDWYTQDKAGNILPPNKDWTDVADLNYKNKKMRVEMINSMKYWIENFDVDGFRCDMAMLVPTDFWNQARAELDKVKPVFMLAEAEEKDLMEMAFDANYSWDFLHLIEAIAKGKRRAVDVIDYFLDAPKKFPQKVIRMTFTSNHDENTWNGSVFERFPDKSYKTFAVYSFLVPGMPLIYSGQEACLNKKIKFFDRDTIEWKNCEMGHLYKKLIALKSKNEALWNGEFGSSLVFAPTENNEQITTFIREKNGNKILAMFNFSAKLTDVKFTDKNAFGKYKEYFTDEEIEITSEQTYMLTGWEYKVLVKL
ncbi:MAG: alpha-amylase [Bacteroidales bacterium]|nr:alpha-amylase [Bacteroidales bacterium]